MLDSFVNCPVMCHNSKFNRNKSRFSFVIREKSLSLQRV
nr:MAG TPA: hypothetical protein [Caudoviricetes sp.]